MLSIPHTKNIVSICYDKCFSELESTSCDILRRVEEERSDCSRCRCITGEVYMLPNSMNSAEHNNRHENVDISQFNESMWRPCTAQLSSVWDAPAGFEPLTPVWFALCAIPRLLRIRIAWLNYGADWLHTQLTAGSGRAAHTCSLSDLSPHVILCSYRPAFNVVITRYQSHKFHMKSFLEFTSFVKYMNKTLVFSFGLDKSSWFHCVIVQKSLLCLNE